MWFTILFALSFHSLFNILFIQMCSVTLNDLSSYQHVTQTPWFFLQCHGHSVHAMTTNFRLQHRMTWPVSNHTYVLSWSAFKVRNDTTTASSIRSIVISYYFYISRVIHMKTFKYQLY